MGERAPIGASVMQVAKLLVRLFGTVTPAGAPCRVCIASTPLRAWLLNTGPSGLAKEQITCPNRQIKSVKGAPVAPFLLGSVEFFLVDKNSK